MPMAATITEIKRNLNKPDQTFECELMRHDGDRVVVSYVSPRPYRVRDVYVKPGTLTLAYYRENLPYIVWKMIAPDDRLTGYYIHLCGDVRITPHTVEYRDLILDVWFFPDGAHRILDEDELDAAQAAGLIDRDTAQAVRRIARDLIDRFPVLRTEFDALLKRASTE